MHVTTDGVSGARCASSEGGGPKIERSLSEKVSLALRGSVEALNHNGSDMFATQSLVFLRMVSSQSLKPEDAEKVSRVELGKWVLFGASGWWSCNAIMSELPLFITSLHGAEKMGSQLSMMTQLGNVLLVIFAIVGDRVSVRCAINLMMVSAMVSLALCAFLWDEVVAGRDYPLLVLMVVAGGVGCMSNYTYWALMISYPPECTKALSIGTSLGGVFTTALAALQMAGREANHPRFGVRAFFIMMAMLQGVWWSVAWQRLRGRTATKEAARSCSSAMDSPLLCACSESDRPSCNCVVRTRTIPVSRISSAVNGDRIGVVAACVSVPRTGWQETKGWQRLGQSPAVVLLYICSLLLHAAAFTMPALMPYLAAAYDEQTTRQQILLWILTTQQFGDTFGRFLIAFENLDLLANAATVYFVVVFVASLAAAIRPELLAAALSGAQACVVLPALTFGLYASYGVLHTQMFLSARTSARKDGEASDEMAERISSNIGFYGQLGSLLANLLAFLIVNY